MDNRTEMQLRQLCRELECRLRRGERKIAEQLLTTHRGLTANTDSVLELIYREYIVLDELGERPSDDELFRRFPQWQADLSRLLEVHREIGGTDVSAVLTGEHTEIASGTVIGPYTLLHVIGEGGFGMVYLAQQNGAVQRKVALKVLKPGMHTRDVVARFESERQALALMEHPHIAKVYDAGATDAGAPYFVMELVSGIPITQFCNESRLPIPERLRLFCQVCDAVQHAHQRGIIHRDLKPSNILIMVQDGVPVPKIIDFGVAKFVNEHLADETGFTRCGQMLGTPQYMSPEQADVSGREIDARSDVYSLGGVLYELLIGVPPIDPQRLATVGITEMVRIIREDDPPKPSQRLSMLGGELREVCERRSTEPRQLSQRIRGDLDRIVGKALEKDCNRRYDNAKELGRDVMRHLLLEPVRAGAPGAAYRARKFVRRHKSLVILTTAVAMALVIGLTFAVAGLIHARREQQRAEAKEAEAVLARNNERAQRRRVEKLLYFHRIGRAQHEWTSNNLARADQVLDECPVAHRGWEWRYLRRLFHGEIRTFHGHTNQVRALEFTPDGSVLASGSGPWNSREPGEAILWDTTTGKKLHTFGQQPGGVTALAFSPDGQRLATVNIQNGGLVVRDVATGATVFSHAGPGFLCVAYAPSGDLLATAEIGGRICLWNAQSGELQRSWAGHRHTVACLAFSPDGAELASNCYRGITRIWDVATGALRHELHATGNRWLAYTPDSQVLATCGFSNTRGGLIRIFDLSGAPHEIAQHRTHGDAVTQMSFSPDGQLLATNGANKSVQVLECKSGGRRYLLRPHDGRTMSLAFHPHAPILATAGLDHSVKLWDLTTAEPPAIVRKERSHVTSIDFSPDGQRLVMTGGPSTSSPGVGTNEIQLWHLCDPESDSELLHSFTGNEPWVTRVTFSRDGSRIVSADRDGTIATWNVDTGQMIGRTKAHQAAVQCLAHSLDGQYFASGSDDHTVVVWEGATHRVLRHLLGHTGPITGIAFHPNGRVVATTSDDATTRLWDISNGTQFDTLQAGTTANTCIAFSNNGEMLGTGRSDGLVHLWHVDKIPDASQHDDQQRRPRVPIGTLKDTHGIICLDFSPDGKRLASVNSAGTVNVWDTQARQVAIMFTVPGPVYAVRFSPDGYRLAVAHKNQVTFWNAAPMGQKRRLTADAAFGTDVKKWHQRELENARRDTNWQGAVFHLTKLLQTEPGNWRYWTERAEAQWSAGQFELAIEDYRTAVARGADVNVKHALACELVRRRFEHQADLDEAIQLAADAVNQSPHDVAFCTTLGAAYTRAGRWNEALTTLSDAQRANLNRPTPRILYYRALCERLLGDVSKAAHSFREAHRWLQWQHESSNAKKLDDAELAECVMLHQELVARDLALRETEPKDNFQWDVRLDDKELLAAAGVSGGYLGVQDVMRQLFGPSWTGNSQLWWVPKRTGERLRVNIRVERSGHYTLVGGFTRSSDYGQFRVTVNGTAIGDVFEGFNAGRLPAAVIHSGPVTLGRAYFEAGLNDISFEVVGKHAESTGFMVGIDYLGLVSTSASDNSR